MGSNSNVASLMLFLRKMMRLLNHCMIYVPYFQGRNNTIQNIGTGTDTFFSLLILVLIIFFYAMIWNIIFM